MGPEITLTQAQCLFYMTLVFEWHALKLLCETFKPFFFFLFFLVVQNHLLYVGVTRLKCLNKSKRDGYYEWLEV